MVFQILFQGSFICIGWLCRIDRYLKVICIYKLFEYEVEAIQMTLQFIANMQPGERVGEMYVDAPNWMSCLFSEFYSENWVSC